MNLDKMKGDFLELYHEDSALSFFSPGRINLIGEHIDYSGGYVFPCAITFGTYAVLKIREDRKIRLSSSNFKDLGIFEFDLDHLVYDEKDDWTNYVKGVIHYIQEAGHTLEHGFDVLFEGNIPNGAGLSSSASLEVLTAVLVNDIYNLNISQLDLVKFALRSENDFVGVQCGIMDQFAVAMGKENTAMLLDTNTLDFEYVPLDLEDNVIVIMNTNKRRGLSDSAYNERREQCDNALSILNSVTKKKFLCDHDLTTLEENRQLFEDELEFKRARHAISENLRTIEAAKVLKQGDLKAFGKLMDESHASLRDDYDVTGIELDTIVASAQKHGSIGARVTGAGFGGCALAIVAESDVESFKEDVAREYEEVVGYAPDFYIASAGQGAGKI